ncbi:MAG TPA: hypothetical protein VMW24_16675 [Sedimentisphaerales bacterium]|nr:hypothetical protein [Sedimentisphaerales bacterium]
MNETPAQMDARLQELLDQDAADKKEPDAQSLRAMKEHIEQACKAPVLPLQQIAPPPQTMLVSFESGHYKKVTGKWKGDSVWTHWIKPDGKMVHINKDKVEYYEEL